MSFVGIRAVVLDLDDTVVAWQTVTHWQWAWRPNGPLLPERRVRSVLRKAQHRWDRQRWQSSLGPVGPPTISAYQEFLAFTLEEIAGHPLPSPEVDAVVRRFLGSAGGVEPFPESRAVLERLVRAGYRCGISTFLPRPTAEGILRRCGLPVEQLVLAGDEPNVEPVPRREAFRETATRLDTSPANTLYVGDLFWTDYRAAARAGLQTVWLDRLGIGERTGADRVTDLNALEPRLHAAPPGPAPPADSGEKMPPGTSVSADR